MKRLVMALLAVSLSLAVVASAGCQKKVDVKSGTLTICTYGEVISEDVATIKIPADKAGGYRVTTVTRTCDRHRKLEALYAAAQLDIIKNDLAAARTKLAQIVASDAGFRRAGQQLKQIDARKKPTPDTGGTQITTKPGTGSRPTTSAPTPGSAPAPGPAPAPVPAPGGTNPTGPVESLLKWAPASLTGYAGTQPVLDATSMSRQYRPSATSKTASLVIAAEQFRDATAAKNALSSQVKSHYSRDESTVSVNGHSAYFGTDGRRFAVLSFTDGAVMVVVEMAQAPDQQAGLRDELVAVVNQLP